MITKEQVLENIKAQFIAKGNTQKISDRTILETVEPLLCFASEETTLDDFVSKVYPSINSTNVNFIKDTTDFIKNYKNEISDPPVPSESPKKEIELPDEAKEAIKYYTEQKAKAAIEAKRNAVRNLIIKDLQEDEKKRFELFFGTQQILDDVDDATIAQSMIKSYTQFTKDFIGNDTAPYSSGGNSKNENTVISEAINQWKKQNIKDN